jgi:BirA family biotin operon repressor/biotin-[acetyl-CoA-carboxylase] ligase
VNIIRVETVDSTNSYLKESARNAVLEEGTVVVTRNQTAGKGQRGNSWESEAGKNITCSILLHPSFLPVHRFFLLSEAVSLGVKETLDAYTDDITVKWPNDIYYRERKIVGILIENELMGNVYTSSVVGIGLNVNQERFLSDAPNPVSLKQITGQEQDTEALLKELVDNILYRYEQLKAGNTETIIRMYHNALYRKTGFHRFEDEEGIFSARIDRVADDGLLHLVTDTNKECSYAFKSVRFV